MPSQHIQRRDANTAAKDKNGASVGVGAAFSMVYGDTQTHAEVGERAGTVTAGAMNVPAASDHKENISAAAGTDPMSGDLNTADSYTVIVNFARDQFRMLTDGIDLIKDALTKGLEAAEGANVEITYIGSPRYRIVVTADEYKEAEDILKTVSNTVIKSLTKAGGTAVLKRETK